MSPTLYSKINNKIKIGMEILLFMPSICLLKNSTNGFLTASKNVEGSEKLTGSSAIKVIKTPPIITNAIIKYTNW